MDCCRRFVVETKDYLNQINRYDRMIQNKFLEIAQFRELSRSISAVVCEERVQTSPQFDKIGNSIAKLNAMEMNLADMIDEYISKKDVIVSQIDGIANEEHYSLLFSRYVEKKTFEKIADEMNYSFRHITRLHGSALKDFEKKYGYLYMEEKRS